MSHALPPDVSAPSDAPTAGLSRRDAVVALGLAGLSASVLPASVLASPQPESAPPATSGRALLSAGDMGWDPAKREWSLPPLPYAHDALEPFIDAQTMTIHHSQHHAAYVRGMNTCQKKLSEIRLGQSDPALTEHWTRKLAFHLSGHINHVLFWNLLAGPKAGGGGKPDGPLAQAIDRDFGAFDAFSKQFTAAATAVEGSGWAWLLHHGSTDQLVILAGEKQQHMAMGDLTPILGVDVWEHAYYLKYQSKRGEYLAAFMNVANWKKASEFYAKARA